MGGGPGGEHGRHERARPSRPAWPILKRSMQLLWPHRPLVAGYLASRGDGQVVGTQVHTVGARQEGDVDVVVDDEQRLPHSPAQVAGELEQLAARHGLVAELHDVGPSPGGSLADLNDALCRGVGSDHVEPRGLQPATQLRIWRSFSRNAVGAVSHSHECLTRRFSWSWNS